MHLGRWAKVGRFRNKSTNFHLFSYKCIAPGCVVVSSGIVSFEKSMVRAMVRRLVWPATYAPTNRMIWWSSLTGQTNNISFEKSMPHNEYTRMKTREGAFFRLYFSTQAKWAPVQSATVDLTLDLCIRYPIMYGWTEAVQNGGNQILNLWISSPHPIHYSHKHWSVVSVRK